VTNECLNRLKSPTLQKINIYLTFGSFVQSIEIFLCYETRKGFAPKLAKGEIASQSGSQDDPRYFQISVPVQPGKVGVQALACWCGRGHAEA
jgi:hypothetical protein